MRPDLAEFTAKTVLAYEKIFQLHSIVLNPDAPY